MQRRTADAKVKICIFIDSEHNEISVVEEGSYPFGCGDLGNEWSRIQKAFGKCSLLSLVLCKTTARLELSGRASRKIH